MKINSYCMKGTREGYKKYEGKEDGGEKDESLAES